MKKQKFRKTQLSLALASVLAGGLVASGPATAVPELDNNDRLGDAGIFQYYTVHSGWQTFFRIINSSDKVVSVKVRYHEAANSREVLDFILFLSPYDMWTGWTTIDALAGVANAPPGPGIRTNDESCIFDGVNANTQFEGFYGIPGKLPLKGARFLDSAITGVYYDNADGSSTPKSTRDRLQEGYVEVIGIAEHDPFGQFGEAVTGKTKADCQFARNLYKGDKTDDSDLPNVLAFNGAMINVAAGQGAGYDPDVLKNFQKEYCFNDRPKEALEGQGKQRDGKWCWGGSLVEESLETQTKPNFDSADSDGFTYPFSWVAVNQRLADGTDPAWTSEKVPVYHVDINGDGVIGGKVPFGASCHYADEDHAPSDAFGTNILQDGTTKGGDLCYKATQTQTEKTCNNYYKGNGANPANCDGFGAIWDPKRFETEKTVSIFDPWRFAQNGRAVDAPVVGGVDAVSWQLMRDAVINEWAAAEVPGDTVSQYFTQWVLTFPTKNFYVDLQTDEDGSDDISPTLWDPSLENDAFAPFDWEFDDAFPGSEKGTSCSAYSMDIWNRDEQYPSFASPKSGWPIKMCYEVNVVNFNEKFETLGLNSNFAITIPAALLPTEKDGGTSERGWARMGFTTDYEGNDVFGAQGALNGLYKLELWDDDVHKAALVGLDSQGRDGGKIKAIYRYGLPVTGFLFSVYNTNSSANNHATVNDHKYTRDQGYGKWYPLPGCGDNLVCEKK
jgi:hypothetical protein